MRFLALDVALEKLSAKGGATFELEVVVEQLNSLQDVSLQLVNHFNNVLRSINGIKFTIGNITLALKELKQDLAKQESKSVELENVYANFEQNIERLTTPRDDIA